MAYKMSYSGGKAENTICNFFLKILKITVKGLKTNKNKLTERSFLWKAPKCTSIANSQTS